MTVILYTLLCMCSAYAASSHQEAYPKQVSDQVMDAGYKLYCIYGSVGTDEFNEDVLAVYAELGNLVKYACGSGFVLDREKGRLFEDEKLLKLGWNMRRQNRALKSPSPLTGEEGDLIYSMSQMNQVTLCIVRMVDFSEALQENTLLAKKLPRFKEEAKKHIREITNTPPIRYLCEYFSREGAEDRAVRTLVGEEYGVMKGRETLLHKLYKDQVGLSSKRSDMQQHFTPEFMDFVRKVRAIWWKYYGARAVPYVQLDRVAPGIVFRWIERRMQNVVQADYLLVMAQAYLNDPNATEGSECKGYTTFLEQKGDYSLRDILGVLDTLAPMYNERKYAGHEHVLTALAGDVVKEIQNMNGGDFLKEMFPQIVQRIKRFSKLSPDQKKRVLLAFCSPHLTAESPEIIEALQQ